MKKLIVPVLIGIVMFAAAFGGAFYLFRYWQGHETEEVKSVVATSLDSLRKGGRTTAFTARLAAVLAFGETGAEGAAPPRILVVPATVRYDMDLRGMREKDVVWDEKQRSLAVKLPPLILSEPEFDRQAVRQYENGAWTAPADSGAMLDKEAAKAAQGQVLQQARDDGPMRGARDASRRIVERAFAAALQEADVKSAVAVRFSDEHMGQDGTGGKIAGREE